MMVLRFGLFLIVVFLPFAVTLNISGHSSENETSHTSIHVASWKFQYVKYPFIITAFIVAVSALKIVFHHLIKLSEIVPESCMLILFGVVVGLLFRLSSEDDSHNFLVFNSRTFFLFLLPPIILESAFSLRDRAFIENIGTILLYAVVGTVLNIVIIAIGLFCLEKVGAMGSFQIGILDCLIFSSLIAAVDPVAVLAIFQEVGVNKMLYFMVFGESLFNDAVTIVMYNLMIDFKKMTSISANDIALGFAAFLCVSFGGMAIGFSFGFLSAFLTRFTAKIRVTEPVLLFGTAYLSYLTAEMFHFSGIISIICCGLNQAQYASGNISSKSYISVHYFSKVACSVTESLIFIILGVMLVVHNQNFFYYWHTGFSIYALILCLIARFSVVFLLTLFVNKFLAGIRKITTHEQFIMAYGGLRGAVSFSLVFMLNTDIVPIRNTLLGATYLIILFTVFVQGITIKPLVHLLRIRLASQVSKDRFKVVKEMNRGVVENVMAGMEEIIGYHGVHYWTALVKWISQHFIRPALQKHPKLSGSKSLVKVVQEESLLQNLNNPSMMSPQQGALWDELHLLDKSTLPASFSDVVLDVQDQKREEIEKIKRENDNLRMDRTDDLLKLRNIIRNPMYKTLYYDISDKNLKCDPIRRASDIEHLLRVHAAYRQLRQRQGRSRTVGPRTSLMLAKALAPMAAGIAMTTIAEEPAESDENNTLITSI